MKGETVYCVNNLVLIDHLLWYVNNTLLTLRHFHFSLRHNCRVILICDIICQVGPSHHPLMGLPLLYHQGYPLRPRTSTSLSLEPFPPPSPLKILALYQGPSPIHHWDLHLFRHWGITSSIIDGTDPKLSSKMRFNVHDRLSYTLWWRGYTLHYEDTSPSVNSTIGLFSVPFIIPTVISSRACYIVS